MSAVSAPKTALVISAHSADFVWRCGGAIVPHQTGQMGWKPDSFLDITPVCDEKRAARYAEGFQSAFPRMVDEL